MTDVKVHHNTRKAADINLAKRQISPASYRAVLAGEISLQAARDLGRDRGPDDTGRASGGSRRTSERAPERRERPQEGTMTPSRLTSRISKDDATQECWCGCGQRTKPHRRWRVGHDQRAKGIIQRAIAAGNTHELSDRLREYGAERGLV
jgi:hypothetical protein